MLIYSDRYRGWGKQKIKQWGPLSAVRSAVIHNCDKLGTHPPVSYWPLWESGGDSARDIMSDSHTGVISGTGSHWVNDGTSYNGTDDIITISNSADLLDGTPIEKNTYLFGFKNSILSSTPKPVFQKDIAFGCAMVWSLLNLRMWNGRYASFETILHKETHVTAQYTATGLPFIVNGLVSLTDHPTRPYPGDNNSPITIGATNFGGEVYYLSIFDKLLTYDQRVFLTTVPYALLQPVSVPYIFDLGATTGGWGNKIFGINPGKVSGKDKTFIGKIDGV